MPLSWPPSPWSTPRRAWPEFGRHKLWALIDHGLAGSAATPGKFTTRRRHPSGAAQRVRLGSLMQLYSFFCSMHVFQFRTMGPSPLGGGEKGLVGLRCECARFPYGRTRSGERLPYTVGGLHPKYNDQTSGWASPPTLRWGRRPAEQPGPSGYCGCSIRSWRQWEGPLRSGRPLSL